MSFEARAICLRPGLACGGIGRNQLQVRSLAHREALKMESLASTPPSSSRSPSAGNSSGHETTPGTILTQDSPCTDRFLTAASEDALDATYSLSQLSGPVHLEDERRSAQLHHRLPNRSARISAFNANEPIKLSATAVPFTPRGQDDVSSIELQEGTLSATSDPGCTAHSTVSANSCDSYGNSFAVNRKPTTLGLTALNSVSDAESRYLGTVSKGLQPFRGSTAASSSPITRYIEISGVPKSIALDALGRMLKSSSFNPPNLVIITELVVRGVIYLHFTDIRDARVAFAHLRIVHPHWRFQYVSKASAVDLHGATAVHGEDNDDAIVVASAICEGSQQAYDLQTVTQMVKNFLTAFGDLLSWNVISAHFPRLVVQVDFYDIQAAKEALRSTAFNHAGVTMTVHRTYLGDISAQAPYPWQDLFAANTGIHQNGLAKRSTSQYPSDVAPKGLFDRSARGQSTSMLHMTPISNAAPQRRLHSSSPQQNGRPVRINRYHHDLSHSQHNIVDIDRIRQGVDVRTTVMLRNIPNKITQAMLKEILDETSHSKYDFMYLRIDFANNCNVGYAFINFEDPWHIIDFVKARAGCRWNRFHSYKVAEVSYATIQGKDCLIQKFRNSSVMMEHPSFRPKIFRTGNVRDAGTEEPFPGPDNTSKMRRSVENAEHVGLFAPRGAHLHREEQRRRRSQYDRGTRQTEVQNAPIAAAVYHPRELTMYADTEDRGSRFADLQQLLLGNESF